VGRPALLAPGPPGKDFPPAPLSRMIARDHGRNPMSYTVSHLPGFTTAEDCQEAFEKRFEPAK
jgi:hypothetical protein